MHSSHAQFAWGAVDGNCTSPAAQHHLLGCGVLCCFLAAGRPLDVTVAAQPLSAGEVALSIPEHLVVTLDRIFESQSLAEMLTAGKLSELACLTLYMMYEKKVGGNVWPDLASTEGLRLRQYGSTAVRSQG